MTSTRRSDFDVTNSVRVSPLAAWLAAVEALYRPTWPGLSMDPLARAFEHFERLFAGHVAGYHGVDTVYHDRQHTLDITLALARLIMGYERQQDESARLGGARAVVGLLTGLFHDVGYLRRTDERGALNGAEFTRTHVSRGARFLQEYLPVLGFGARSDRPVSRRGLFAPHRRARGAQRRRVHPHARVARRALPAGVPAGAGLRGPI